ncbi:MAG TPA: hypothetical protein VKU89_00840 [Solirubrobacteraceae bacterium]|nr:hypothetical protein [Solirubrobacteraceae bacterium]
MKAKHEAQLALRPSARIGGLPRSCTRSALHLHVHLTLCPRPLLARLRKLHGSALLRAVLRIDGHRVASRRGASLTVSVPARDFGIGRDLLQLAVSVSGRHLLSRTRIFCTALLPLRAAAALHRLRSALPCAREGGGKRPLRRLNCV